MEYVIADGLPFEEVEVRAMEALEQHGFVVLRTFSLRSVTREIPELADSSMGFTVLLLYHSGPRNQPAGLVTLHQRRQQTVIRPVVTHGSLEAKSPRTEGEAERALQPENASLHRIVSALIAGGMEISVDTLGSATDPSTAQPEPIAEVVG